MEDKIITKDTLIDKPEQASRFLKFANEHYEDYKKNGQNTYTTSKLILTKMYSQKRY